MAHPAHEVPIIGTKSATRTRNHKICELGPPHAGPPHAPNRTFPANCDAMNSSAINPDIYSSAENCRCCRGFFYLMPIAASDDGRANFELKRTERELSPNFYALLLRSFYISSGILDFPDNSLKPLSVASSALPIARLVQLRTNDWRWFVRPRRRAGIHRW